MATCMFAVYECGDVVIVEMYQYIPKYIGRNRIFHCEFDGVVKSIEILFKIMERVLTMCPYKENINVYVKNF